MKVTNFKQVSSPPTLLGARLQTTVLPIIVFYFLLLTLFSWNFALLGCISTHLWCVYLTQKDIFLVEALQSAITLKSKKMNRRSTTYVA